MPRAAQVARRPRAGCRPASPGWDVLCLAAGGGWQSVLYAVAGARVTVVDLSPGMLQLDVREAERRGLSVTVHEGSMDDLSMLAEQTFRPRASAGEHLLRAGHRSRLSRGRPRAARRRAVYLAAQAADEPADFASRRPRPLRGRRRILPRRPAAGGGRTSRTAKPGRSSICIAGRSWSAACAAPGSRIEDLREPYRGDPKQPAGHFGHRGLFVPPYVRMKARRLPRSAEPNAEPSSLWLPD